MLALLLAEQVDKAGQDHGVRLSKSAQQAGKGNTQGCRHCGPASGLRTGGPRTCRGAWKTVSEPLWCPPQDRSELGRGGFQMGGTWCRTRPWGPWFKEEEDIPLQVLTFLLRSSRLVTSFIFAT